MLKLILTNQVVKFLHLSFVILTLVATGCKSLSNVGSHNYNILDVTLTKDDFKRLNGTYSKESTTLMNICTCRAKNENHGQIGSR